MDFETALHYFRGRRQTDPDPIARDRYGIPIKNIEQLLLNPGDDVLREQTRVNLIDLADFFKARG